MMIKAMIKDSGEYLVNLWIRLRKSSKEIEGTVGFLNETRF
jgi:hypothetical protein